VLRDQLDGFARIPFVHEDELAADRGADQKPRQSADMEKRKSLQRGGLRHFGGRGCREISHEPARHRAQQQCVHQVGDVVALCRHSAFRIARRARSIEDRRQIGGFDRLVRQAIGVARRGFREIGAKGRPAPRHDDRLQVHHADQRRDAFRALTVDQKCRGRGIVQGKRDFGRRPPGIDRDRNGADRLHGPEAHQPFGIVAHADGDAIAFFDSGIAQEMRQRRDLGEVLPVGDLLVAIDEEYAVIELPGGFQHRPQ